MYLLIIIARPLGVRIFCAYYCLLYLLCFIIYCSQYVVNKDRQTSRDEPFAVLHQLSGTRCLRQ